MRLTLTLVAALAASVSPAADPPAPEFPRRLLFVQVCDYLYLSPLTHATRGGPERTRDAAGRLAAGFGVPTEEGNDQLFILSDAAGPGVPLPTKGVIAKTLEGFCATTRGQDRVVVYLGAHAVERDGKAFLVPIDGDPAAPDSLLPVAEVYAKLKGLVAAQKVVVWDACRHNPERFAARRGVGPMAPALFKALADAPEGVQVRVSCSPGERALEYFSPRGPAALFAGSAYLDALAKAAADERPKKPVPGGAIPVGAIHKAAAKFVGAAAKTFGTAQTPALTGSPPTSPPKYDPREAPAKRFALPSPPGPPADVKALFGELTLPPLAGDGAAAFARLPSRAGALNEYAADATADEILKGPEKYPLRVATLRALAAVRDAWPLGERAKLPSVVPAPVPARAKRSAGREQDAIVLALVRLEVELEDLTRVAGARAKETKRWQANYDFALAELRLRVVVLEEYNRALARVKTESLPDLPDGATGWRFVPFAKVAGQRSVRKMLTDAREGFARLAADHKGTPWEVLARRSLAALPSATWEPVVPPKDGE
jgi:hypothetical protein